VATSGCLGYVGGQDAARTKRRGIQSDSFDTAPANAIRVENFSEEDLLIMAEMEHGRWVVERLFNGQRYGKEKVEGRRIHRLCPDGPRTNKRMISNRRLGSIVGVNDIYSTLHSKQRS